LVEHDWTYTSERVLARTLAAGARIGDGSVPVDKVLAARLRKQRADDVREAAERVPETRFRLSG
jgi:hypothetical protein